MTRYRRWLYSLVLLILAPLGLLGQSHERDSLAEQQRQAQYLALIDSSFVAGGRGDYALASRQLREALRLYPRTAMSPMLLNNLGGLQQLQGDTAAALLSYTAALEQDPQEATTRFNRAKLFVRMKRPKAALTDFALLIAQEPPLGAVRAKFGSWQTTLHRGRTQIARELRLWTRNEASVAACTYPSDGRDAYRRIHAGLRSS